MQIVKNKSCKLNRSYAYEIFKLEASLNDVSFSIEWSRKGTAINTIYSGAPAVPRTAKLSPTLIWERKGNPSMNLKNNRLTET